MLHHFTNPHQHIALCLQCSLLVLLFLCISDFFLLLLSADHVFRCNNSLNSAAVSFLPLFKFEGNISDFPSHYIKTTMNKNLIAYCLVVVFLLHVILIFWGLDVGNHSTPFQSCLGRDTVDVMPSDSAPQQSVC